MKHTINIFSLVLVTSVFAGIPSLSHAQVTQEWVQTYSANSNIAATALDNAGNIYAAGYHTNGSIDGALLLKYDPAGNLLWSQTYLPTGSTSANANALVVDGNSNVIVTGSSCCTSQRGFTLKYDASGQLIWSQTSEREGKSVSIDGGNNVYVATTEDNQATWTWTGLVIKYDASGVQQWTANGYGTKIMFKDGYVYLIGQDFINLPGNPPSIKTHVVRTAKYNAVTGVQVWVVNYSHSDKKEQYGKDIVVDGSGNVYVTGNVFRKAGGGSNWYTIDWVTLKYNSSGIQQWVKLFDGNATDKTDGFGGGTPTDYVSAIAMDNSGNVIVTGTSYTTTGQFTSLDMTTAKYNPSGTQLWVKTYDGPEHKSDVANAIKTTASGNTYISGYITGRYPMDLTSNATTVKYTPSGTQEWDVTYGGASFNEGSRAVDVDGSGNVYVGGYAQNGNRALLLKYSQTGTPKESFGEQIAAPDGITLLQNYPNPFNPSTTITYTLVEEGSVVLRVYNALGIEFATLVNEIKNAGTHSVTFNATNLESGVYTYTLKVAGQTLSRKMVFVK